ncbi:MAG: DUF3078 domain-containing protein [Nonlabens sp.]|uniref:DUF3078 domain-containing protein n=1 Tax=Nonlabens sp. TaxID=1888209 RepID=UPI003EF86AA9
MRFYIFLIFFSLTSNLLTAQDSIPEAKPSNWASWGRVSFIFNQSAFNPEWQGGGVTNISGDIGLSYDLQFKRKKFSWDSRFITDFGLSQVKDQRYLRKTTDRIELNSILGNQINQSNWNYSTIFNFKSQYISGYEFKNVEVTNADGTTSTEQTRRETSGGFSPAYFQVGIGLLWKKSKSFNINLAPATTRLITVSSNFTDVDETDAAAVESYKPFFGVEANKTARWEVGAAVRGYNKVEVAKNIQMENILSLYSDYLDNPENIDIDFAFNLYLKVNKHISGNFAFQAIYDDNAIKGFQVRQVIGLGFKYDIGEKPKKKA